MKANNQGKWSQKEGVKASKTPWIQIDSKKEGSKTQPGADDYTKFSTKKV